MIIQPLDAIPLPILYILTVLVMLASVEIGYRLGFAMQRKSTDETDPGIGNMVGATLALLAFLLAFVVSFAVNIFNERRHLVVDEANAIGTAYLRTGYLNEPYHSEAQDLLSEYANLRVPSSDREELAKAISRSEQIHNELWAGAERIAIENPTPTTALYLASLNEVIDLHMERVSVGLGIRVPPAVLWGVYFVAIGTTFLVGIQSGNHGKRNFIVIIVVILILSMVFLLIVDLDRSREGLLQVPQQALLDLQRQLSAPK